MELPSLRSIVQTGKHFYSRHDAFPLYEHCHFVVQKAASTGIIESEFLTDIQAYPERRRANYIVAQTALYHVLKPDYREVPGVVLPAALMDGQVAEQIAVFSRLTESRTERRAAQRICLYSR